MYRGKNLVVFVRSTVLYSITFRLLIVSAGNYWSGPPTFYRATASSYATAVLDKISSRIFVTLRVWEWSASGTNTRLRTIGYRGISCRNSVRPSVCPSVHHMRALYKTKQCTVDILIPHERAITLSFLTSRLRQISASNVSTVRDSEISSFITNRKSTTGFSTSYRWST